jgi:osmotically-inducible protein OsmY
MRMNEQSPFGTEPSASETRLREQIREQLRRRGRVDVTKIGVDVHESQVLLWGSVASESERAIAVEVARSVAGSKNVLNRIHVYRSQAPARGSRSGCVQLDPGNP